MLVIVTSSSELEVFQEARAVVDALLPVAVETQVEDARLERVVRLRQLLREGPRAVEPRLALRVVELNVHIGGRRELPQPPLRLVGQ